MVALVIAVIAAVLGIPFGVPVGPLAFVALAICLLAVVVFLVRMRHAPADMEAAMSVEIGRLGSDIARLEERLRPRLTMRVGDGPEFEKPRMGPRPASHPDDSIGGRVKVILVTNESALRATGCRVEIIRAEPEIGETLPVALEWMHA